MKTKLVACLSVCLSIVLVGCASMPSNNESVSNPTMARLKVVSQTQGEKVGSIVSTVSSVDGETGSINTDNTYVQITPGYHKLAFNFYKIVDLGGSGPTISVSLLGKETDLFKPKQGEVIKNLQQFEVEGYFKQGVTYYVDASHIEFNRQESNSPAIDFGGFGSLYEITGEGYIREMK